jgi:hypothetical protein
MEKIVIKPEGVFYCYFDDQSDKWIEKDIFDSTMPITWYLDMTVELQEKVSILKILELFERYDEHLNFVYVKALKALNLDDVLNVIDQVEPGEPSSLKATCLVWVGEIQPILGEDDPVITITSALIGLDTENLEEDDGIEADDVYQLTNFDFVEWVRLPLYLDTYLDFAERDQPEAEFGGEFSWTLHNLFDAIFSEISLNLYVAGLVSNPDIIIAEQHAKLNVTEFFKYLDDLGNISDRI